VIFAFWINKAADTPQNIISYCFSTATIVTRSSF